ncbi:MAG: hypothetical protein Q9212_002580 [Teloschistes hypoglaucus]
MPSNFAKTRKERKREDALRASIEAGDWIHFLLHDADATRESFFRWFNQIYLQSPQGQSTALSVKHEILEVCDPDRCLSIERAMVSPQTIEVFKAWEAIPMDPESREMSKARDRLVRDVLMSGNVQKFQARGLYPTPNELEQARQWIHLESYGSLTRYSSLRLPIMYKSLVFDPTTSQWYTFTAVSEGNHEEYGANADQGLLNPERVRISIRTLEHLINGTHPSQQGQSIYHERDPSLEAAGPPAKWDFQIWSDDDDDKDQSAAGRVRLSTTGQERAGNPETSARGRTPDSDLSTEIGEEYYRTLDESEGIPDRAGVEGERREEECPGFIIPPDTATTSRDEEAGAASSFPSSTQAPGTSSAEEPEDWVKGILSRRRGN